MVCICESLAARVCVRVCVRVHAYVAVCACIRGFVCMREYLCCLCICACIRGCVCRGTASRSGPGGSSLAASIVELKLTCVAVASGAKMGTQVCSQAWGMAGMVYSIVQHDTSLYGFNGFGVFRFVG